RARGLGACLGLLPQAYAAFPGRNGRTAFYRFAPSLPPSPAARNDLLTADPDGSRVVQMSHAPGFSSDWSADSTSFTSDFPDPDASEQIAAPDVRCCMPEPSAFAVAICSLPSERPAERSSRCASTAAVCGS